MTNLKALLALVVGVASPLFFSLRADAQILRPVPKEADGADIVEHLEAQLPLDLTFVDERTNTVRLGDYFGQGKPVLLTLNYYSCPMLCTLQLNGLVEGLRGLEWTAGNEFEIVTVSINHRESPALAFEKKKTYVTEYGREAAGEGWHFLVGQNDAIVRLAETVGFQYEYDPQTGQYAHPAVAWIITPEGRVSRYLYGVQFDPQTLRYSMVEASQGRVGTAMDRLLLLCFHYDETRGRYAPAAMNIMRMGGALTAVVLGGWLLTNWLRGGRRPRTDSPGVQHG